GEIIARFGAGKPAEPQPKTAAVEPAPSRPADRPADRPAPAGGARPLHLTIDELSYPAYMVNHSFELTWYNDPAREKFLGKFEQLPPNSEARNLFLMLRQASGDKSANYQRELLQPHLAFAKDRGSKASPLP